jgi:demethylmenaquinone methyltransferase/2-methoxy-6-polyprenyl-1,4-benzoquinol methylase
MMDYNVSNPKESWKLFNQIAATYDILNRILSLNLDRIWRRSISKHLPSENQLNFLDLATGTGDQIIALMEKSNKFAHYIGIDPAENMLNIAKKKLSSKPFQKKVYFQKACGTNLPFEHKSFDGITLSFGIRNIDNRLGCLQEAARVLKKGGKLHILEFSLPKNPLIRTLALAYLRFLVPNIGGIFSKNKEAYAYLNKTIESFPSPEEFCRLMQQAGFQHIQALPLTFGIVTHYIGEA